MCAVSTVSYTNNGLAFQLLLPYRSFRLHLPYPSTPFHSQSFEHNHSCTQFQKHCHRQPHQHKGLAPSKSNPFATDCVCPAFFCPFYSRPIKQLPASGEELFIASRMSAQEQALNPSLLPTASFPPRNPCRLSVHSMRYYSQLPTSGEQLFIASRISAQDEALKEHVQAGADCPFVTPGTTTTVTPVTDGVTGVTPGDPTASGVTGGGGGAGQGGLPLVAGGGGLAAGGSSGSLEVFESKGKETLGDLRAEAGGSSATIASRVGSGGSSAAAPPPATAASAAPAGAAAAAGAAADRQGGASAAFAFAPVKPELLLSPLVVVTHEGEWGGG